MKSEEKLLKILDFLINNDFKIKTYYNRKYILELNPGDKILLKKFNSRTKRDNELKLIKSELTKFRNKITELEEKYELLIADIPDLSEDVKMRTEFISKYILENSESKFGTKDLKFDYISKENIRKKYYLVISTTKDSFKIKFENQEDRDDLLIFILNMLDLEESIKIVKEQYEKMKRENKRLREIVNTYTIK